MTCSTRSIYIENSGRPAICGTSDGDTGLGNHSSPNPRRGNYEFFDYNNLEVVEVEVEAEVVEKDILYWGNPGHQELS